MNYFKSIVFISLVTLLFSCTGNTCDLSGCSNEGIGWTNGSECTPYGGACRLSETGGYCSKSHALRDI